MASMYLTEINSMLWLAIFLMNFECQPCGIFENLSHHQEYEAIDPTTFASSVGLVDITNMLLSSNFMDMMISISVIFDTGANYSCSSSKGYFLELEENVLPRNIKGIEKGLDISVFGIVKYSIRSESGRMIALRDQKYYFPRLPKYLRIISPQLICT